ncbi:FAD-dependent oxidoreductase [Bacillus spongiae]|uniref:FAD-dependent oxidoreductase n=1 Tax=Bacillus spongiae TaxID=2683610 RepID=A0ABU8HGL6_9BACI
MNHSMPKYPFSYWRESVKLPTYPTLEQDIIVDVAIVGAGITGITTAYLLTKAGMKVALLDAGKVINGTTGHTTAKISAQHGLIYDELIHHFGKEQAKLYYEANSEALTFIKERIQEHQIQCDFTEEDAYVYSVSNKYEEKVKKEFKAYEQLGIDGELVNELPIDLNIHNAIVMKKQAQFHPVKYLLPLLQFITTNGGKIFENTTCLEEITDDGIRTVHTKNGSKVTCDQIVACSHFPFYDGNGFYFARLYAERSYSVALKIQSDYPGGIYLSADEPKRSIRYTEANGEKLLLVGGENHKVGQGGDTLLHYETLQRFGEELFEPVDFPYRWSAQDLMTLDKVPYIGHITKNKQKVFIATGFQKWGMTNGTIAAKIITDSILNKPNNYENLYTPSRFKIDPSLKTFVKENTNVAYHFIEGKLGGDRKPLDQLSFDEGAVITFNGKRAGAYKDEQGQIHLVDTTCTHLGCEVEWNHGDRSWDCPCHGSRFSYNGDVLEGPADQPLKKLGE